MADPEISVVMSVYNDADYLEQSIESILDQTFDDFEFILIDDGSTDGSLGIMESFRDCDDRIRVFQNDHNLGLAASLNTGISKANGQYIARQDADDISMPNRLKIQYQYLEENTDIYLCGTGAIFIDSTGDKVGEHIDLATDPRIVMKKLKYKNCIYHSSILFRNTGIKYREKFHYSQDYDLYLRLLSEGKKIANLAVPLLKHRIDLESVNQRKSIQQKKFGEKAKNFFDERSKKVKDSYANFDPDKILNADITTSQPDEIRLIEKNIQMALKNGDLREAKEMYAAYREKQSGWNLRDGVFFLAIYVPYSYEIFQESPLLQKLYRNYLRRG